MLWSQIKLTPYGSSDLHLTYLDTRQILESTGHWTIFYFFTVRDQRFSKAPGTFQTSYNAQHRMVAVEILRFKF